MKNDVYLVLPGCDDTNRGDQALIWETVAIAKEAGFDGQYYMVADEDKSRQSAAEGIKNTAYILKHPSTHFKKKNNIQYGKALKIKWAVVSIVDSLSAVCLFSSFVRKHLMFLYSAETRQSVANFERAKAAFVKGGGFLHTYGSAVETYTAFFNLYHVILAQKMGVPVYVMPNSFGPFKSIGSGRLIRSVLNKCNLVCARENVSRVALESNGVMCKKFPDLAFYLRANPHLTSEQQKKLEVIPFGEKECVALTMRPYRFPSSEHPEEDYMNYKNSLCKFVKFLADAGYYPVLIEHTYSETEHERDISCINDVVEMLGDECDYYVYSDLSLDSRQLKYVYSKFRYIIGTRFHSVIFSVASGVPALAITYGGNKGEGIMQDMGIADYALPIGALNYDSLVEKFLELVRHRDEAIDKINAYLGELPSNKKSLIEQLRG